MLLLGGVAGLFLPFLQGVLMIVGGLALIDLPCKRRLHVWLKRRVRSYRPIALRHMRLLRRWRRRSYEKKLAAAKAREAARVAQDADGGKPAA